MLMALLVDPPQRDSAAERTSAGARSAAPGPIAADDGVAASGAGGTATIVKAPAPDITAPESTASESTATAPQKLAEPPITGGRVEELMGALIRVLSHSPLARPLPAVVLTALGLGGVAFVGLCATAPRPSVATPPVLLPLTSVARNLGAPHLPDLVANLVMYIS